MVISIDIRYLGTFSLELAKDTPVLICAGGAGYPVVKSLPSTGSRYWFFRVSSPKTLRIL